MIGGSEKITSEHLARLACPYVRQSTPQQVRNNTESRELQYELKGRAIALGWPAERVRVIDTDLGISADSAALADRVGFRELAGEVALGNVGLILGVGVSRLARDNAAWYGLLDVCALTGTLIADSDRIYDPADYSDRLTLGLKGTIAEAELHLIKGRLIAGLRHKAAKGELQIRLPAGFDYAPDGTVVKSADESVREAIAAVFQRFFELLSVRQVTLSVRDDGLLLPRRRGPGEIEWVPAAYTAVHDMLVNPVYAGAFAYGRRQSQRRGRRGRPRAGSAGADATRALADADPRPPRGLHLVGAARADPRPDHLWSAVREYGVVPPSRRSSASCLAIATARCAVCTRPRSTPRGHSHTGGRWASAAGDRSCGRRY